eukprot:CAMPEP_0113625270 /NCGR_PEP_ID=MMETSP0017_2-20120614/13053_1 /TAXON_ID=2856 /ORGANISM="Cylindrotheca closterium" /LENGTH=432 /DNA_ID=CAMNT_0000535379 /DNA_START=261 /DNA_END=1559 /DNA_ORIENTATION=+ /assembly_acc=CAM_ASM_000147
MPESVVQDPIKKQDLAVAVRDQYIQLPRSSGKTIDQERCKALLLFADSSRAGNGSSVSISQYSDRDISLPPRRQARSKKRQSDGDSILIDCILSRDVQKGIEFIVAMREDIFQARKMMNSSQHDDGGHSELSKLKELDNDLKKRLRDWFCPNMMDIRRISYENSAPSVIESIVQKEAVHPIQNPQDLRDRLGEGKRVFALFSPLLPDKPLVFCHVALTDEIPCTLEQAASSSREDDPKVATFYSITNGEPGLIGLQLGLLLLKLGMQTLQSSFPSIDEFVTLSPIPNFKGWAESHIKKTVNENSEARFPTTPHSTKVFDCGFSSELIHISQLLGEEDPGSDTFLTKLEATMQSDFGSDETQRAAEHLLYKLACQYLLQERDGRVPKCRVARFHVGNGAEVFRINVKADLSQKGMNQSYGFMVNYRYDISNVV